MTHPALREPPIPALYRFDGGGVALLGRGDAPAFSFLRPAGAAPAVLICDQDRKSVV